MYQWNWTHRIHRSLCSFKSLHLDKNDYYGSSYSSYSYDSWLKFGSSKTDGFNVIIDSSSAQHQVDNDLTIERNSLKKTSNSKVKKL